MLTSLFSLFHVSGEFHWFLHRGKAGFLLSARPSSPLSNSFFICSFEIGFLPFLMGSSRPSMLPVFAKPLMLYLPR